MTRFARKRAVVTFLSFICVSASGAARASEQAGTLTQIEGKVLLFTHPSSTLPKTLPAGNAKTPSGEGTRALYEGEYYLVRDAKVGDRVEQGNILRTPPSAKARVVFENGDQYNVGPGTAYRVFWKKDSEDAGSASPQVNLMYGKLRGIVAKGGPRSKLVVKTPSASMGVRGTDFFIASQDADKGTEVSIIRGAVEVKPKQVEAKPVIVKEGFSAEVAAPSLPATTPAAKPGEAPRIEPAKLQPVVELRQTTKEDYVGIQKSSEIKQQPVSAASADPSKATNTASAQANGKLAEKIAKLEKKAIETTVTDIQKTHPEMLKNVDVTQITSVTELHQAAVTKLAAAAPKAPEKRKPYKSELEDLEGGAYEKYFQPAVE